MNIMTPIDFDFEAIASRFGKAGANSANQVYSAILEEDCKATIRYNTTTKNIVIKTLSIMTFQTLGALLYEKKRALAYYKYFPKVRKWQDAEGNFLIKFSPVIPAIKGYPRLVHCLPQDEYHSLYKSMLKIEDTSAKNLANRINQGECVCANAAETRNTIVTALKAYNLGYLNLEQIATLHIIDGAIRDLVSHPTSVLYHKSVDNNGRVKSSTHTYFIANSNTIPAKLNTYKYNIVILPSDEIEIDQLPSEMQYPILQRFFAFTDGEWNRFCNIMAQKPLSEKNFTLLCHPEFGCWSGIASQVQKAVHLCHPVSILLKTDADFIEEKKMVVPTFSMFQAALEVKAQSLELETQKLIPTYYHLEPKDYRKTKQNVGIPLGLYFPEISISQRYSLSNPHFKAEIDGWKDEGPYASILHDFYHALRELAMTKNISKARYYLAALAEKHPLDRKDFSSERRVSNILIDGELIHSHPPIEDTIFKRRPNRAQSFGELFYTLSLKQHLHPKLKEAFIENMVLKKNYWEKEFHLGREDLLDEDKKIYDQIRSLRGEPIRHLIRNVACEPACFD